MSATLTFSEYSSQVPFWDWFNSEAAPYLAVRRVSFTKIFNYLDSLPSPIIIVETGCLRMPNNWSGDGQSTLLFDKYTQWRGNGSRVFTVDINKEATDSCRKIVGDSVYIHTGDSVDFLRKLRDALKIQVSLFYLDSYDVDFGYPFPSAAHHLKELVAISPMLLPTTLVVIDDCPLSARISSDEDGKYVMLSSPEIGGKGFLVAQYASQVGAKVLFSHYQAGFIGL